jgi:hypothetical protein
LNPLLLTIGGIALIGGGYLAYKFVQTYEASTSTTAKVEDAASTGAKYGAFGVAGLAVEYGGTAYDDVTGGLTDVGDKIAGWL